MPNFVKDNKLAILLLTTIAVRALFLIILGNSVFFYDKTGEIHGSTAYDDYALNLIDTGVYGRSLGVPDANIAPLYSYVVAGVYATFGRSSLAVLLLHIILDCITIALVYDIARRLFRQGTCFEQPLGEWVGFGAGMFTALYPYLIFQNLTLIDTPLFMMLMHLFIWLMILLREQDSYTRKTGLIAVLAGMILGVTTLGRALLPLFAILTAFWFLMRLSLIQTVLRLLPVAIISVLVMIPWMIRTYQVYDDFVTVALNTGENLWQGNNPMTIPLFNAGYDAQWSNPPVNAIRGDTFRNNDILTEAALDYLRENPQEIVPLLWTKFLVYWSLEITPRKNPLAGQSFTLGANGQLILGANPDANLQDVATLSQYESGLFDLVARPVHVVYFGGLLLLALIGIGLSMSQWRELSLLWFLQISMTIMYLIFHPSTRYRVPTDPLLFTFSAYALLIMIQAWLARRQLSA
ncbi:MAG: glycosyltransferase family 39 protein [Phototrophicaceae bacterium]